MRGWRRAATTIAVIVGAMTVPVVAHEAYAADCGNPDLSVPKPYPIAGYFMYSRARGCDWHDELERMHRLGSDTVVQFAPQFLPRTVKSGDIMQFDPTKGPDPAFVDCKIGGVKCYDAALADLRKDNNSRKIVETFAYATSDAFTDALFACPAIEKRTQVVVGDRTRLYWWLFFPHASPGQGGCPARDVTDFDLVMVAGDQDNSLGKLLTEAQAYGMKVYAPMPAFPSTDGRNSNVDTAHLPAFTAFNRRVLTDYQRHYGNLGSFAGVYQTREYLLDREYAPVLTAYRDQHADVRQRLPGKRVLASPYWSSRKFTDKARTVANPRLTTPAAVTSSVTRLYQSGVDVVAPQDGRGSGTAGLFWPYEGNRAIDADPLGVPLAARVGDWTYGDVFGSNSTSLFQAAATARDNVNAGGRDAELWANVEAFEPEVTPVCAPNHRTTKKRLDQAITHLGSYVTKVISYQWDPLYTCQTADSGGFSGVPLVSQIEADFDRPVISYGFRFASDSRPGLVLDGYHLDHATVTLTWYDKAWQMHTRTVPAGWWDRDAGKNNPRLPRTMEAIWVPFDWTDLAPDFYVHADVTNNGKAANYRYSLAY